MPSSMARMHASLPIMELLVLAERLDLLADGLERDGDAVGVECVDGLDVWLDDALAFADEVIHDAS